MINKKNLITLLFLFLAILSHFSSSIMACGGFYHRGRSRQRACFANQKTIAGAMEMYNLDYNLDIREITEDLLFKLKKEGYLQFVPTDPGFGDKSWSNYFMTDDGVICCLNHGFIQAPEGLNRKSSPFKQLKAAGETRKYILSRASQEPSDAMNARDLLQYEFSIMSETLWPIIFLMLTIWLPASIWRLRYWRYGQKVKLALLIIAFVHLLSGPRHLSKVIYMSLLMTPLVLSLDMLIFAVRLLLTKSLLEKMARSGNTDFPTMDDISLDKAETVVRDCCKRYAKSVKVMKIFLIIAIIPFIPWITSKHGAINIAATLLAITLIAFIVGAVTGTVRFSNGIRASCSGSDGTIPGARIVGTAFLFVLPFIAYGKFAVTFALASWPAATIPLITLASFFFGRSIAVVRLNKRFIGLLNNLPHILSAPLKKHISTTGISAHPARLTCSTTNYAEGVKATDHVNVALPDIKLSLSEATCPVCGEGFPDNKAWVCNDCNTPHHSDCWEFNGTCTTFGCNSQSLLEYSTERQA